MSWRNGNRIAPCGISPDVGTPCALASTASALCGHCATRRLPPIVCRSLLLHAPFGRLPAPTHLAQRASSQAGTASDVRAFPYRCAKLAAFRQVTQRSNPRDGLCGRYHASLRPVQCRSPSDPPNGSSHAPTSAPRESWVKDFRAGGSSRNAARANQSAVRRRQAAKQPHERDVVSRARSYPLESLRRSRRAVTLT